MRIPLSRPDLTDLERSYVHAALDEGWISGTGAFVRRFEEELGARVGRTHTIAVANGTLALELVLRALDIGRGDEVILPALTFAAPAMSVLAVGASVVLADVSEQTWTIDPDEVRARMTPRTKAVIAVDVLGHPADYDELHDIGVPVLQDAAEAHGARYKGRAVGSQGDASIFSFHANKAVTTGEGGSVGTDRSALAHRMRLMANHGMDPEQPYVHYVLGRNYRMTNLAAAVGVGQLERWDDLVSARALVSQRYSRLLDGVSYTPRPSADWATPACWLHTIAVSDRDQVLRHLRRSGVDARGIWPALDEQPVLAHLTGDFPVARDLSRRALWLPTYAGMSETDMSFVASQVAEAVVGGAA